MLTQNLAQYVYIQTYIYMYNMLYMYVYVGALNDAV